MLLDESLPLEGTEAQLHSITPAYVRSIDFFGLSGRLTAAVPLANGKWSAEIDGRDSSTVRTGFGDPLVSLGVGLLGAPALRAADMATYRPRTLLGASLRVRVPIGQYNNSKFFNLGTNRWKFVPGVGVAQYVGRWVFEAHLRAWFSTTNRDFFGGNTVAQDPLFGFQLHAEYAFKRGLWGALSFGQSFGGATTVNGVEGDNAQTNNRFGATLAIPIQKTWSLKAAYAAGLSTRFGGDFDTFAIALQYRWGGT
ncbi:MAG: transporter [Gemmatimonadota bacterium]